MNWLRNFMYGRNGVDHLTIASLVFGLLISVIVSFTRINYLGLIAYIPYGYSIFRMLSRNTYKRQEENRKFLGLLHPLQRSVTGLIGRIKDKERRYYSCPVCKSTLRVPKGKGKITITCPKCKHEITKKT